MSGITQGYERIVEGYKTINAAKNRIEILIDESSAAETELIEIKKALEYGLNCIEGGYVAVLPGEAQEDNQLYVIRWKGFNGRNLQCPRHIRGRTSAQRECDRMTSVYHINHWIEPEKNNGK